MLAQNNENSREQAIYYLSQTLVGYDIKYVYLEKLCLTVVFVTKKLGHYMLNHTTYMISKDNPLKYMISKVYHHT